MARTHLVALNRSLRARGISSDPVCGPIVLEARNYARLLDEGDLASPSTGVGLAYRQLLKEIPRWAAIAAEIGERTARNIARLGPETASKGE